MFHVIVHILLYIIYQFIKYGKIEVDDSFVQSVNYLTMCTCLPASPLTNSRSTATCPLTKIPPATQAKSIYKGKRFGQVPNYNITSSIKAEVVLALLEFLV